MGWGSSGYEGYTAGVGAGPTSCASPMMGQGGAGAQGAGGALGVGGASLGSGVGGGSPDASPQDFGFCASDVCPAQCPSFMAVGTFDASDFNFVTVILDDGRRACTSCSSRARPTGSSSVEFYLDRFFAVEQPGDVDILDFRAFLRALTVPSEGTGGVAATAPPRVLFIWPDVVTVECVVGSVEFRYKQVGVDGTVLVYTASVSSEEILDTRVTSEALREGA